MLCRRPCFVRRERRQISIYLFSKKEGNRPRSGVCADGAADVGEEKARAAVRFFDHLFQLQGGFFVIGMADADRLLLQIVAAFTHQLDHAFQHFFPPAPFFKRNKRPVLDVEKRLDVEQAPKGRGGFADAAAAREVVQVVNGENVFHMAAIRLDRFTKQVVRCVLFRQLDCLHDGEPLAKRGAFRVDDCQAKFRIFIKQLAAHGHRCLVCTG